MDARKIQSILTDRLRVSDFQKTLNEIASLAITENSCGIQNGSFDAEQKVKSLLNQSGFLESLADQVCEQINSDKDSRLNHVQVNVDLHDPPAKPIVASKFIPKYITHERGDLSKYYEESIRQTQIKKNDLIPKPINFDNYSEPIHLNASEIQYPFANIDNGNLYLSVNVPRGRAFLSCADISEDAAQNLVLSVLFAGQRVNSKAVSSCTEPTFGEQWIFELPSNTIDTLMDTRFPMLLVVSRLDDLNKSCSLVGSRSVEWRQVLETGYLSVLVELLDPQGGGQVTIGLLEMQFELLPRLQSENQRACKTKEEIYKKLFAKIIADEKSESDQQRLFFMFSKQWWGDFLAMRSIHSQRLVKIFAMNEEGRKILVTRFVRSISSNLIPTPQHAARFVSLIPTERHTSIGETKEEIWLSPQTFILSFRGDFADHAVLLCCLLLGFSLSAYVTCGTRSSDNTAHIWVTTINNENEVWFWDSCSGLRYKHTKDGKNWAGSIGCCFNDEAFYANIQISDSSKNCSFNFDDKRSWKEIPKEVLRSMNSVACPFNIFPSTYQSSQLKLSSEIEIQLKQNISVFRSVEIPGSNCIWDERLEHLMGQCLWNYEMQRLNFGGAGNSISDILNSDFQCGVRRLIPEGYTFKQIPRFELNF
ncbi:Centrosomal protein of 76 kDa [Nowakowskiella sp. JEL0078]|nr:Centrosomal protein of 76 kDa [Nowakowskiella sp. JEL0078]